MAAIFTHHASVIPLTRISREVQIVFSGEICTEIEDAQVCSVVESDEIQVAIEPAEIEITVK